MHDYLVQNEGGNLNNSDEHAELYKLCSFHPFLSGIIATNLTLQTVYI